MAVYETDIGCIDRGTEFVIDKPRIYFFSGEGLKTMEEVVNLCEVQEETLKAKIYRFLGYGDCLQPDFENDPYDVGYAEANLQTVVFVHLGFADRIRLLLTGGMVVRTSTKTDQIILRSYSKSNTGILPAGYRP